MSSDPRITTLQTLLNDAEATEALLAIYLDNAKWAILNRMYPFGVPETVTDIPERYENIEIQLAQRYFLRRGAEGEITHNENGVNRSYASVNDLDLLMGINPMAKVV